MYTWKLHSRNVRHFSGNVRYSFRPSPALKHKLDSNSLKNNIRNFTVMTEQKSNCFKQNWFFLKLQKNKKNAYFWLSRYVSYRDPMFQPPSQPAQPIISKIFYICSISCQVIVGPAPPLKGSSCFRTSLAHFTTWETTSCGVKNSCVGTCINQFVIWLTVRIWIMVLKSWSHDYQPHPAKTNQFERNTKVITMLFVDETNNVHLLCCSWWVWPFSCCCSGGGGRTS